MIVLEPISIYTNTDWAHQNDRQNLIFVKAINVVTFSDIWTGILERHKFITF